MATDTTVNRETYVPSDVARYEEDRGAGWVAFAGILLLIVGTLNIIEGIAAVDKANFFVANQHYIAGNLSAWGWTMMFIGIAEVLVGLGVIAKNQFARWAGVGILGLNAIAQLMFIPAYPLWSLSIFAVDVLAIYGLVAYGARMSSVS
jgi:hypothetical protein